MEAFVIQRVSQVFLQLSGLGVFGTFFRGVSDAFEKDAVLAETVMSLFVPGATFVFVLVASYVMKSYGDWKREREESAATQGLY